MASVTLRITVLQEFDLGPCESLEKLAEKASALKNKTPKDLFKGVTFTGCSDWNVQVEWMNADVDKDAI